MGQRLISQQLHPRSCQQNCVDSMQRPNLGILKSALHKCLEVRLANTIRIRSAINRYLNDFNCDIDIVRDKTFKAANQTLDGKLKQNVSDGSSRPTKHKAIIFRCRSWQNRQLSIWPNKSCNTSSTRVVQLIGALCLSWTRVSSPAP